MTNKPKRGRPPKEKPLEGEVMAPEAVANPDPENYSKRPIMSGNNDKITITVAQDGRRHIDCGGLSLMDVLTVLTGVHKYLYSEMTKGLTLNGTEEGTTDAASGGNS
jgi:hypothetical protein